MDSGASIHFTGKESDFSDLQMFPIDKRPPVSTANGQSSVHSHGTVFVENSVTQNGKSKTHVTRLHPVYFMPGVSVRLMSMGQLLKGNMRVQGDEKSLTFLSKGTNTVMLEAAPKLLQSDTIYWVDSKIVSGGDLIAHQSVHRDDYELWHRRLGHPSHQVLEKLGNNTNNFPSKLRIPKETQICEGCAKGKMHNRSFPENAKRASRPFQRIHSDLKEYAVLSYHKYKWFISFLDDHTSHSWITLLRRKSEAKAAARQFIAMVKNQYHSSVEEWMSDLGGEYTGLEFETFLKEEGIKIVRTAPYMHQSNGRVERFNRTLDEKAESMRQQACLPDSWWEFCVIHGNYIYNRTPMRRLEWITPSEAITKEKPDLSHLCILGCGAYVFILKEVRKNKLSPKSELMVFLRYSGHHTNMIFMRSLNIIIFTATTALFDEKMFPKCVKTKVPPVTQLQDPTEEPVVEIEIGVPNEDEPYAPPPFIPQ